MEDNRRNGKRRPLGSIDIAKFIGSIMIFAMHCDALQDYNSADTILEMLARWGVPLFFISSSYFLFSKSVNGTIDRAHLKRYVFRVGMLYVCWGIFNLPSIYIVRLGHENLRDAGTWLTFIKNSLLSSTFTGSWYLTSSIFSACLVYLLSKRLRTKPILAITSVFYVLCVLTSVYKGVLPSDLSNILDDLCFPLNLFAGCFYFALGKYVSENEARLTKHFTKARAALLFIAFYGVYFIEVIAAKRFGVLASTDAALSTAALAFFLFLFCLQVKVDLRVGALLRKLSIIIYCCQSNVLVLDSLFVKMLSGYMVAFLLSALVVAAVAMTVLIIQKRTDWKWANYLT